MLKSFRLFVSLFFLSFFLLSSQAKAENPVITRPTDFWFEYTEPTQFIAETFMMESNNSDPQLWLYDEQGTLLYTNDDFRGLQSYISMEVQPGRYRLRAGTCCHQPDVWRDGVQWNVSYELTFNGSPASTTTSSTTTTTTLPPTTTTEPPQTTTTSTTTTTTTTTTIPETTTTWPQTTTIPTTIPTTTAAPVTVPATTTTVLATTTTTTTTTTTVPETTTTAPPVIIPPVVTADQAAEIATSQEALAEATEEQATEIFAALEIEELSDAQLKELVVAVQSAPEAVREAFEEEINIFGGQVDSYVPVGSTVPVGERRSLIAIGIAMSVAPAAIRRK
jgi:hypothetical protein